MAPNFWLQQLAVASLLVTPIQSLQSSLPAPRLPPASSATAPGRAYPTYRTAAPDRPSAAANGSDGRKSRYLRRIDRRCRRSPRLRASETGDEVEIDEDIDAFMEELLELEESTAESTSEEESPHFIQRETAVGIGGNDGFVYDVNALKRNLVQESVRGCKRELLVLLGDGRQDEGVASKSTKDGEEKAVATPRWRRDRDDSIEERLSALVQANPVSTTTDSNLLDGEWSFAFATNSASTILDTSRFLLSKTKRIESQDDATVRGGPWRFRAGKTEHPFRSSTRQIYLENLTGDENAHVVDETRVLGGLFRIRRRYDVYGLTRTAVDLDMTESESRLFGFCVSSSDREDFRGTRQGEPLEIQVLYLDTDLCICTTGAGLEGPLHVYTKSDLWVTGKAKRKLKLIAKTASWISTWQSPLRIRQRIINSFTKKDEPAKWRPGLKSVNIGELDVNEDGTTREDPAWDGEDDPFVHLSPGERMEVLKTMSLQDIYQSALERKEQNKKRKKRKWGGGNRGNKFKRPDL